MGKEKFSLQSEEEKLPQSGKGEGFEFTPELPVKTKKTTEAIFNKELLGEKEKENLIRSAISFEELYEFIKKIGPIQGSKEVFETSRLIDLINRVQRGLLTIDYITRTYGLRDTVERLLDEKRRKPENPSPRMAMAALELPSEDKTKEQALALEQEPKEPVEPLTDEESLFYHRKKESGLFGLSSDERDRYWALDEKYRRFQRVTIPNNNKTPEETHNGEEQKKGQHKRRRARLKARRIGE